METMMMVISGKHPQICFEKKKGKQRRKSNRGILKCEKKLKTFSYWSSR